MMPTTIKSLSKCSKAVMRAAGPLSRQWASAPQKSLVAWGPRGAQRERKPWPQPRSAATGQALTRLSWASRKQLGSSAHRLISHES
jgi:hypothetical protein